MPNRAWTTLLLWGLLLAFGLSFGLNYGVANHTYYLLPSLSRLHPELWLNDWTVTRTHHYHTAFAALAAGMLTLDASGWLMAVANVLAVAAGMATIWALLRNLLAPARAALAMLIVLSIASATRTGAPGTSYVFSVVFQPSTLGSLGALAACWLLVAGRPLWSGVALAAGGAFHANYLILCLPVFGIAQLAQGRRGLVRRGLQQLVPPLLVLPLFLPLILATSSAPVVAEAQRVYQDIRSPHHYRVEVFFRELVPWLGWQLLGLSAAWGVFRDRPAFRRLFGLLLGFWAVIVPSLLLCAAFVIRPLIQLYPWRLTADCALLAQAVFAASIIERIFSPAETRKLERSELALMGLGLAQIAYGGFLMKQLLPLAVATSAVALALLSSAFRADPRLAGMRRALLPVLLMVLVLGNWKRLSRLSESSSLLGGADRGLQELCSWTDRHTQVDSVLLTPPDVESVRFHCRRAIVVDWKTAPMVPEEVLAWQHRIEDVTGRSPLRHASDQAGYAELDAGRLQRLRAKYGFDYVIARRGAELAIGIEPAFRGERFVAYRLPEAHGPWSRSDQPAQGVGAAADPSP